MSGQCMRQGCARGATVGLVFDAVTREVWLDPVEADGADLPGGSQTQLLCSAHAEALRVPVGWAVLDRRSPLAAAAPDPEPETVPAPADPGSAAEAEPTPDAAAASGAEPAGDRPAAGSRRTGSMLDRAFAWAGPQRSVITERGDTAEPVDESPTPGD